MDRSDEDDDEDEEDSDDQDLKAEEDSDVEEVSEDEEQHEPAGDGEDFNARFRESDCDSMGTQSDGDSTSPNVDL